jgi:hypothetical protein
MGAQVGRLLRGPILALTVALVGIGVTILIGYVFSVGNVDPCYSVSGVETIAAVLESETRLHLLWDGKDIPNVAVVRIALWNAGKQYIDAKNTVPSSPICIVPPEGVTLLSEAIVNLSRKDLALSLTRVRSETGEEVLQVDLLGDEALERGDGAVVQVLYSGPSDGEWRVAGRIKGDVSGFARREWRIVTSMTFTSFMPLFALAIAIVSLSILILALYRKVHNQVPLDWFGIVLPTCATVVAAMVLVLQQLQRYLFALKWM